MPTPQSTKNEKKKPTPPANEVRPPAQSQVDEERGDWEGMGQARFQPDEDAAKPTPGANSITDSKEKPAQK